MVDWIDDTEGLERWVDRARDVRRLAVDCEANGFHAYTPRLCLVQLARELPGGGVEVALVDALAFGGSLGGGLAPLFENPSVEKILHGASNDVRMLDRDAGVRVQGLLDTEVAARLLGRARSGLAALSEELTGQRISKSGQRLDWARRPLPDKALSYAAEDVKPLFGVRDALVAELEEAGRREWLDEECRALEGLRWQEPEPPSAEDLLARAKGTGSLEPASRAVFSRLLLWREREAARRDVPAIRVVSPSVLRRIAIERPDTLARLSRAGVDEKLARRYGRALLAAVRRGRTAPSEPARGRGSRRSGRAPVDGERLAELKRLRRERAAELRLDEGTLCPTDALREIARRDPDEIDSLVGGRLRRWQLRALGLGG
jgi:ribonuclease D